MTVVLITGANRGLGFETARQLCGTGAKVLIGARDPERGRRAAEELGARFVEIDVTSDESVRSAALQVGALDVLVNNAGVLGDLSDASQTKPDEVRDAYETNVFGPVRVLHEFLPLLKRSEHPVVVNVSSGLGSISLAADLESRWARLAMIYSSSKAALNMLTLKYAAALPEMRINCVDPGYTATDLNNHRGTQSAEEGARVIVELALVKPDGPTGGFFSRSGRVPW